MNKFMYRLIASMAVVTGHEISDSLWMQMA